MGRYRQQTYHFYEFARVLQLPQDIMEKYNRRAAPQYTRYSQDISPTRGCWKGVGTHPQFQVLDLVSISMSDLSEDGFWEFVDGQWKPTEKQLQALQQGARPYNSENEMTNHVERVTAIQAKPPTINTTKYQHKVRNSRFNTGNNKLIFGTGTLVLIVAMIIVVSTLSPGTIGLLDKIRDSDGDGITDYDELKAGTNPELRDSDYDNLDDDEDDCPTGQTNWDSKDPTLDLDGDGCLDEYEDTDDDNDGYLDVDDDFPLDSTEDTDTDGDGIGDNADTDDDGDGVSDGDDYFPLDPNKASGTDTDGDGQDDEFDEDDDGDTIIDLFDDCPLSYLEGWESTPSTDNDGDGCRDSSEDNDDDDDNINDEDDDCPKGSTGWTSNPITDYDGDGCRDSSEDNDDDGDNISDEDDDCPKGSAGWTSSPSTDYDGDGCRDSLEDTDDDNDGVNDNLDQFPLDATEWSDFDDDGIGDNADSDDDNDGVYDWYDVNDRADTGVLLTLDSFKPIEKMDYFDNQAEIYICVYLEDISLGCAPDGDYVWEITTGATRTLNFKFFADLPETQRYHYFKITVWDDDVTEDDRMDINPDSEWDSYTFHYDSLMGTIDESTYASGTGDGNGYDGALWFSVDAQDLREQRYTQFIWEYDNGQYWVNLNLDYDTYSAAKNSHPSTHTGCMGVDCSVYADPDAQYIINLADTLYNLAREFGHTSSHDVAEFIYAFVGSIQYERDIDGVAQYEYPKYPIEMLWEGAGDCEDAAILYVSLVEALGYDAILVRMFTKDTEDSEWGGHFMAGIDVSGGSGAYFYYDGGPKSGIKYWMVETTNWINGVSEIGWNPWHDMKDYTLYDVEES